MNRPLVIRALGEPDGNVAVDIWRRSELGSPDILGFEPTHSDLLRQTVDDPDFEPSLFLGAFSDGKLAGHILAIRRPWKNGHERTGFVKWVVVHPHDRCRGVARQLLSAVETVLVERSCKQLLFGSSSPGYVLPGVPAQDKHTQRFLEQQGWQPGSTRISVRCQTEHVVPMVHRGIITNQATAAEKEDVLQFVREHFSLSWAKEIKPAFDEQGEAYCQVLRTQESGAIVGFCAINAANRNWLGPMGVHPSWRRQGLGRYLLQSAVAEANGHGIGELMIPWVNDRASFYERGLGNAKPVPFIKFSKALAPAGDHYN